MAITELDRFYMLKALSLARASKGISSPNPAVGAIVVRGDNIIGRGSTQRYGSDHAEVVAIRRAKRLSSDLSDSTLYVTLEPCCFFGKTPPCTELIIREGISRVVVGARDINPKINGRGLAILREAGIEVLCGIEEGRITRLNEDFNKYIISSLPFCTAKYAMSIDGKMATDTGDSKWITSERSRLSVQRLRKVNASIMVGANTLVRDNPNLTLRISGKQPLRIILLGRGDIPLSLNVLTDEHKTLFVVKDIYLAGKEELLKKIEDTKGKSVIYDRSAGELIDLRWLFRELASMCISSILLEGGASLLYSALSSGLVDKVICYIAPKILQGNIYTPFKGLGVNLVKDAYLFKDISFNRIGDNMMFTGYISYDVAKLL